MFHLSSKQYHPFHLVNPSPWPLISAISALMVTVGGVSYMHAYDSGLVLLLGLLSAVYTLFLWWRDVIREATYEGHHTVAVQTSHRLGFNLFIVSEVMFFFGFFWAFFHSSLSPAIELGCCWPPTGVSPFNPWGVPFLNTLILLLSGVSITFAHHCVLSGDAILASEGFVWTLILAAAFTFFQYLEYKSAPFTISDGVYGSTFFMMTGFHGLHVIIGTSFILYCYSRLLNSHFTRNHHVGFEASIWYWHFVDVVWLFLFATIYWWGSVSIYLLFQKI
jgi:cytochrome c oxidase subunit 3